jgi:hypothetical protein
MLDAESFRQQLAGICEPARGSEYNPTQFRESAANLCFVLAACFNRDALDPMTLWDRIATAIETSCAQVDDGDLDRLVCLALGHVKADHALVAREPHAGPLLAEIVERDEAWRLGFVRYLKTHSYAAVIHGRRLWETHKAAKQEGRNNAN